jgi:adenylate cyclase
MMRRFRALSRIGAVSALLPVVVVAVLSIYRPAFLAGAERATSDALLRLARARPPDGRVAIVDIDERSLSAIGQWPWRRDVLGTLVSRVRSLGASAVAVDILLAEAERTDARNASTDPQLAEMLRGGGVVLGFALTFDHADGPPPSCLQQPLGLAIASRGSEADADPFFNPFFHATGAICSLPVLAQAAGASGFLNAAPDSDGILRRVPLLLQLGGRVYPSLALAAVATATGVRQTTLRIANSNTLWLSLDDRPVPLDGKSHLLVRYRGAKRTFPYVSAADVMSGRVKPRFARQGRIHRHDGARHAEVVATPLDTLFAAVEVQATVADNLLRGDFLRRPEHAVAVETLVALASGALAILLVVWLGFMRGAAVLTLCSVASWTGAVALFFHRRTVSPLFRP